MLGSSDNSLWATSPLRAGSRQIDAYQQWDQLTGDARHGRSFTHFPVLLELAQRPVHQRLVQSLDDQGWQALVNCLQMSLGLAPNSVVHTALVPRQLVGVLETALLKGVVKRYTLGAGCQVNESRLLDVAVTVDSGPADEPFETLGIIDDGCCLAHENLRESGTDKQHRLLALWDQDPSPAPAEDGMLQGVWVRQAFEGQGIGVGQGVAQGVAGGIAGGVAGGIAGGIAYGAELTRETIEHVLSVHDGYGEAAERRCYKAIGRPDWGPPWHSHGARVLHLLSAHRKAGGGHGSSSNDKPLIFVQVPRQTIEDTSGDSLGMHVVNGARYIVQRTKSACAKGRPWRTTICISLGSIAGPHDGTSMAEQALRELATEGNDSGDVTIVVAAGNSGAASRVHAQGEVGGNQRRSTHFLVNVPFKSRRDSFVEVWMPEQARVKDTFVQVTTPSGASAVVQMGQFSALAQPGKKPAAALIFPSRTAQGDKGTMALLCVAPTASDDRDRAAGEHGIWSIKVTAASAPLSEVHAWVERDDVIIGGRRRQQTRFEPLDANDPSVNDDYTLSSLANSRAARGVHLHVAGGIVGANAEPYQVAGYTSAGPLVSSAGAHPRMAYAVVDRSASMRGVGVPGFYSGSQSRIDGTSAAAPQVAASLAAQAFARETSPHSPDDDDPDGAPPADPWELPDESGDGKALRRGRADRRQSPLRASVLVRRP